MARAVLDAARAPGPSPSSTTSTAASPSAGTRRIALWRAPLWRMTLVAASRTVHASTASTSGGSATCGRSIVASIPAASSAVRAPFELGVEPGAVVAADRLAHLAQRVARDGLDVGHVGRSRLGVVGQALARELGLERDDRERMAEQVVQVAGEALALVGDGQPRHLGAGVASGRGWCA